MIFTTSIIMKYATHSIDSFIRANIVTIFIPTSKNFITNTFFLQSKTKDPCNVIPGIPSTHETRVYFFISHSVG